MSNARWSEEDVRRWLTFLARGLRNHNRTMFQMEDLQPSWLPKPRQQSAFLIMAFWFPVLIHWALAVIWMFALGLFRDRNFAAQIDIEMKEIARSADATLGALVFGPLFLLWLAGGLALYQAIKRRRRSRDARIQPGERLAWRFGTFWRVFRANLKWSWFWHPLAIPAKAFIQGFFAAFETTVIDLTSRPNERIHISRRNAILFVIPGLLWLLWDLGNTLWWFWRYANWDGGPQLEPLEPWAWLASGTFLIMVLLYPTFRYGGLDALEHYFLRWMLVRRNLAPWRYAEFLDYAANELGFLQKAGGGYIFMHRHLLEYFARQEMVADQQTGNAEVNTVRQPTEG